MLKRILAVFIWCLPLVQPLYAQRKPNSMNDNYLGRWREADSLMEKNMPESAARIVTAILEDAEIQQAAAQIIKAQLFLMSVADQKEEQSGVDNIKKAEGCIAAAKDDITRAIWQSITAQLYWDYFQANRYKFYNRTAMAETVSDDIDTWDAAAFTRKAGALYSASLENRLALQSVPVESYAPVMIEGKNTRKLRPTVYDLLVFRAIAFFENDERDVINAADKFEIDGALWFEEAARFSEVKVKVKNADGLHFQALKLYQEVIAFHGKDKDPSALIDADLQRLAFVYNNSVSPDKDSLYKTALEHIEQKYTGNPASAQASYLVAVQMMGGAPVRTYGRKGPATPGKRRDLPAVRARLQDIVAKYPDTEGGINAHNLLLSLQERSLDIKAEEVNIPGEYIKALLTYKNTGVVFMKLYKVPGAPDLNGYNDNNETVLEKLYGRQPQKSWRQSLPASQDMEQHSIEVPVDALEKGCYQLLVSLEEDIKGKDNLVAATRFQVSDLSLVMEPGTQTTGHVLNRKSGYPVGNTQAVFWAQSYNNRKNRYEAKILGNAVTDANGKLAIPYGSGDYGNRLSGITLRSGTDTLQLGGYFNNYYYEDQRKDDTRTFFFTDRAIYRPGQTIYFKGIMLRSGSKGKKNEVIANQASTVDLYDANGQKIATLELTTNGFGSFNGKFTAPEGTLGGQMYIQNSSGSVYFSVEEYKRPKFYVELDTIKANYALDEAINITGTAKAYAGNNISGANVKYRVVRRARFPYYWCYYYWGMPLSPEAEITNGAAVTSEDGTFNITFTAVPDRNVAPQSLPVFTYTVYADVTDINGETRSGNTNVNCGYRSLQIAVLVPEDSKPQDLDTIIVRTENLNGVFTPASVRLSVARLKFPGFLRKRLWEMPDQFALGEQEFRKLFPFDEYKDESNYMNWEKEPVLYEQTVQTTNEGKVIIPETTWYKNGWYVIEVSGKDLQGNDITEKKYTHVWAPGKREINQKELIAYTDKEYYEPGETAELWVATGADNPYLLKKTKLSRTGTLKNLDNNPVKISIGEEDRGGLAFSWLYVYNNRVYTGTKTVNVPWSDKELQLEWGTHRDKLQPGAGDEWTLTIKGSRKEKVAAELLAGMYDASLDAFRPHSWNWDRLFPSVYMYDNWGSSNGFGAVSGQVLNRPEHPEYRNYEKSYDEIFINRDQRYSGRQYDRVRSIGKRAYAKNTQVAGLANEEAVAEVADALAGAVPGVQVTSNGGTPGASPVISSSDPEAAPAFEKELAIRTNLNETAFFFPQLETDVAGNVKLKFTMPEALTEWKLMAFAHTKDWKTGYLEGKVKTQKDLMVMPGLPRFLRQNDDITISTKISNLSGKALSGTARLELVNALTGAPVNIPFRLKETEQAFTVAPGQSATASWTVHVPESTYDPVVVRITAKAGDFSDGEENTLPVITNRTLVTETLPLPVRGNQEKNFTLDKLLNNESSTISNHALTVEFTGNPAWYAVQALPYLMEYPYECAEQTFNRFYANALAGHIVAQSPKIEKIFATWKNADTAALLSNLQKNEELKSALLEETPWVMEAKNEQEQKQRIASLFETHKLARGLDKSLDKLAQMQLPEGGFPWFKGMLGDRYITQYIVTGLARLQYLGVKNAGAANKITDRALAYLDRQITGDYKELLKNKTGLEQKNIGYLQLQYLYMRSFYKNKAVPAETRQAFDYYKKQAARYWPEFNPYMEGQISLALNRLGDAATAKEIIASLRETAVSSEEMGMYWKNMPKGYWWYEAPVEAQSLLIEAFGEIAQDNKAVDAMKVWLLKQKQTQNWTTTKATADACYALLLHGSDWLSSEPVVTLHLGKETIRSSDIRTEAGTGYFKKKYRGGEVKNDMGNIKVSVAIPGNKNEGVSWGAVYWQYFEDLDKITAAASPLSVRKQLYIERNTERGPVLTEIRGDNELKPGDKIKVRLEIRTDRDMEYVHLKDMRAVCFEPVNVLGGYKYQGGLGYYENTKDVSSNFFFDYLRKGTYVFEYPVFVTAKGDFSTGIATIQCMYAPEFSSHSEGSRIQVK